MNWFVFGPVGAQRDDQASRQINPHAAPAYPFEEIVVGVFSEGAAWG